MYVRTTAVKAAIEIAFALAFSTVLPFGISRKRK
jgi:hypothetical protein